jgi:hypothetical protein
VSGTHRKRGSLTWGWIGWCLLAAMVVAGFFELYGQGR